MKIRGLYDSVGNRAIVIVEVEGPVIRLDVENESVYLTPTQAMTLRDQLAELAEQAEENGMSTS